MNQEDLWFELMLLPVMLRNAPLSLYFRTSVCTANKCQNFETLARIKSDKLLRDGVLHSGHLKSERRFWAFRVCCLDSSFRKTGSVSILSTPPSSCLHCVSEAGPFPQVSFTLSVRSCAPPSKPLVFAFLLLSSLPFFIYLFNEGVWLGRSSSCCLAQVTSSV